MNVDDLIRDALRAKAAGQQPLGPGFADRVLAVRRRRRVGALASIAAVTTAVVAIAVGVPQLDFGKDNAPGQRSSEGDVPLARFSQFDVPIPRVSKYGIPLASEMSQGDVIAHPDQSPPRDLIAAGNSALAAYHTSSIVKESADKGFMQRTYWILNQKTGKYEKDTRWSDLAVAPGMRTAAVLERNLPADRIGVYDLVTRQVEQWIPVDRRVGRVVYSPDGSKLLATGYDTQPDPRVRASEDNDGNGRKDDWYVKPGNALATGFYVLDLKAGKGSWSGVTIKAKGVDPGVGFVFNTDGTLVSPEFWSASHVQFYDFKGNKVATPAKDKYLRQSPGPGLSPDGRLMAGNINEEDGSSTNILDPHTGKRLHKTPGLAHFAWADNKRLVAWDIAPGSNGLRSRLVLVTIGSDETVPLSGSSQVQNLPFGHWTPLFAQR